MVALEAVFTARDDICVYAGHYFIKTRCMMHDSRRQFSTRKCVHDVEILEIREN